MNIAFCIRNDYLTRGGGDVVQMLKTKQELERRYNVSITIITNPNDISNTYEICHIFNFSTVGETKAYINAAKNFNCKIACSSIYWDYKVLAYAFFSSIGIFKLTKLTLQCEILVLKFVNLFYPLLYLMSDRFKKDLEYFVDSVDIILPNSEEEIDLLSEFIKKKKEDIPYFIVYNASEVSTDNNNIETDDYQKYNLPENFVLQVGRIEPIKNQLKVVEALFEHKEIPIVFIGSVAHKKYFTKLKTLSDKRGNVYFVNEVKHEDVKIFYRRAKLHILPSLRESPGLVSLEAIAEGCIAIVSKFPYSPFGTYFKGICSVDPLDKNDIKRKILECYQINTHKIIKRNSLFSWEITATQTYEAYQKILNQTL